MNITLTRYYGDKTLTKSTMTVVTDRGLELTCEAREPAFADYSESFPGCARYCLPTGKFKLKVISTTYSPMTLKVMDAPAHKRCIIGWRVIDRIKENTVFIGQGDGAVLPQERRLKDQEKTFQKLEKLVYRAFSNGEDMTIEIINSISEGAMTNSSIASFT